MIKKTIKCYWCNHNSKLIYKDFPQKGVHLYRCEKCKIMFQNPFYDTKELYSNEYFESWGHNYSLEKLKKEDALNIMQIIEKENVFEDKNLLDIGCAQGYLIEIALDMGWDARGIESSSAIKYKNPKLKERIKIADFLEVSFKDELFSVITTISVFEHINNPKIFLEKVLRILKKNGIWVIVVPNLNSLARKIFGKKWPHFNLHHIFYYNKKFFKELSLYYNLSIIIEEIPRFNYSFFYLLNQIKLNSDGIIAKISNFLISVLPHFILEKKIKLTGSNLLIVFRKRGEFSSLN